jgi:hypothetical protein
MKSLRDVLKSAGFKDSAPKIRKHIDSSAHDIISAMWKDEKKKGFIAHLLFAFTGQNNAYIPDEKPHPDIQCALCHVGLVDVKEMGSIRDSVKNAINLSELKELTDNGDYPEALKLIVDEAKDFLKGRRMARASQTSDVLLCDVCHKALLEWALVKASVRDPEVMRIAKRVVFGSEHVRRYDHAEQT